MKKIIKDILILCVITIICGGLLGYVYQITKNPIQHQSQQSKQDAYLKVMKEATSFKAYKENDIKKLSKKLKGDYGKNGLEIENALKAYHQKQTIGYIIQVIDQSIPRFEETIKFISESLEEKEREEFSRQKVIKNQKH